MLSEICKGLTEREICFIFFFFFFSEFYSPTQVLSAIYAAWKINSGTNSANSWNILSKGTIGHESLDSILCL